MQKNGGSLTFLLSRLYTSNNSKKVRRDLFHTAIILLFLIAGFSAIGFGVRGVLSNSDLDLPENATPLLTQVSAQPAFQSEVYDYSRPQGTDVVPNSGGPASSDADPESVEIENRLKAIQAVADPAFIPSVWAHTGKINNEFGFRRNPFGGRTYEFHPGMDIDGERGQEILAPANGTVIKAGWTGGYGNMVEIEHGNGLSTRYGHMSKIEVEVGDTITRGQLIGLIGSTGRSTGPHLHYELRLDDRPVNPRHYLPPEPIDIVAPAK